ncbi:MAG: hypothetical protein WKF79_07760 [Nocardioides sp.]
MRRSLLAAVAVVGLVVAGCGEDDPYADYCEEVKAQQKSLTEIRAAGGPTALIDSLPSFEALEEKSPRDLRDEWETVTRRISVLIGALEDAGLDPETYDSLNPPDDVSEDELTVIDAAARELASAPMIVALNGVEQHALDVCKTPLSL